MQHQFTVPDEFSHYFWDAPVDTISIVTHTRYIIERLLNEGDVRSLRWVIQRF
jgi:hypothetical protein